MAEWNYSPDRDNRQQNDRRKISLRESITSIEWLTKTLCGTCQLAKHHVLLQITTQTSTMSCRMQNDFGAPIRLQFHSFLMTSYQLILGMGDVMAGVWGQTLYTHHVTVHPARERDLKVQQMTLTLSLTLEIQTFTLTQQQNIETQEVTNIIRQSYVGGKSLVGNIFLCLQTQRDVVTYLFLNSNDIECFPLKLQFVDISPRIVNDGNYETEESHHHCSGSEEVIGQRLLVRGEGLPFEQVDSLVSLEHHKPSGCKSQEGCGSCEVLQTHTTKLCEGRSYPCIPIRHSQTAAEEVISMFITVEG